MKDEIRAALRKIKLAIDPDSISMELLEAREDNGIDKITTLLKEIYGTGQTSPDIYKPIVNTATESRGNNA